MAQSEACGDLRRSPEINLTARAKQPYKNEPLSKGRGLAEVKDHCSLDTPFTAQPDIQ
jgi:hypothetical protein